MTSTSAAHDFVNRMLEDTEDASVLSETSCVVGGFESVRWQSRKSRSGPPRRRRWVGNGLSSPERCSGTSQSRCLVRVARRQGYGSRDVGGISEGRKGRIEEGKYFADGVRLVLTEDEKMRSLRLSGFSRRATRMRSQSLVEAMKSKEIEKDEGSTLWVHLGVGDAVILWRGSFSKRPTWGNHGQRVTYLKERGVVLWVASLIYRSFVLSVMIRTCIFTTCIMKRLWHV